MTTVIKLRLKLSDFIDTDLENIIMERIKAIENDLNIILKIPRPHEHLFILDLIFRSLWNSSPYDY